MATSAPTALAAAPRRADHRVLDHAVWLSLGSTHQHQAERRGAAARFPPEASPFAALAKQPDARAWADLARLVGPGGIAVLFQPVYLLVPAVDAAPPGWEVVRQIPGVQMVTEAPIGEPDTEATDLDLRHAGEASDLVTLARPGPWASETIGLGPFVGRRHGDRLVAMAGTRLQPPGYAEISAVSTAPEARGQGLASSLIRHLAWTIEASGRVPFLHAAADSPAIPLYRRLGFSTRAAVTALVVKAPE